MRVRVSFHKTEAMRFTGHLDLFRTWERTIRRAGLPLAYSQGFHPQPRINLAAALPLGFTSACEVVDIWLETALPLPALEINLRSAVPPGINITGISEVDPHQPALQTQVVSAEYLIELFDPCPDLADRLQGLLAAESLPRQWRGKDYDLRPLIENIQPLNPSSTETPRFLLKLSARPSATGRPEEVLATLGIPPELARIHRTSLSFAS